jgi:1-acyl-sn-glycerol-3-phosphate acyltransferase
MKSKFRSAWIWITTITLTIIWLPLLAIIRVFDSDPVLYRTGIWFRRLPVTITKANPSWRIRISGEQISDGRRPYVVVSNHQSIGDIPLICHLPWAMKWIAKVELFQIPVFGWMMRMAEHIPLDRKNLRQGAKALLLAERYLKQKCSVMIFPEGKRSPDNRVLHFVDGAFLLAIRAKVPILPVALEGSQKSLPQYIAAPEEPKEMFLKVLPPIDTNGMTSEDVVVVKKRVRQMIIDQIAEWRGVDPTAVDAISINVKST